MHVRIYWPLISDRIHAKDLSMNEFPATSAVLTAAAFLVEDQCKKENDDYMICKSTATSPSDCLGQGDAVHECVHRL